MQDDKIMKKLKESFNEMEKKELMMNTNATTKKMASLAPNDDSSAIVKFIDLFNKEPKTNNSDWIEVMKLLPVHPLSSAESDFELKVWRSKAAIINYWKSKKNN